MVHSVAVAEPAAAIIAVAKELMHFAFLTTVQRKLRRQKSVVAVDGRRPKRSQKTNKNAVHGSASWLCIFFPSPLLSLGSSDRSHNEKKRTVCG